MNGMEKISLIAKIEDAIEIYNSAAYNRNQYNSVNAQIAYEKAIAVLTEVKEIADIFLNIVLVFDGGDYMYRPISKFIIDGIPYIV